VVLLDHGKVRVQIFPVYYAELCDTLRRLHYEIADEGLKQSEFHPREC
jgi:hypothetical protein